MEKSEKIGRNELCPCGSGLKFKNCCLKKKDENEAAVEQALNSDEIKVPEVMRITEKQRQFIEKGFSIYRETMGKELMDNMKAALDKAKSENEDLPEDFPPAYITYVIKVIDDKDYEIEVEFNFEKYEKKKKKRFFR